MKSPTQSRSAKGFSLLELLIVITVMLVMVGLSVPALNTLNNPRRTSIQELKGTLESARGLAIRSRADVYVAFTGAAPTQDSNRFRRFALFTPDPTDPHPDPLRRRVVLKGKWHALEEGIIFGRGTDFEIPSGVDFSTIIESPVLRVFPSNLESSNGGWALPFLMFNQEGSLVFPGAGAEQYQNVGIIEGGVSNGQPVVFRTKKGTELVGRFPESECLHFDTFSGRARLFSN